MSNTEGGRKFTESSRVDIGVSDIVEVVLFLILSTTLNSLILRRMLSLLTSSPYNWPITVVAAVTLLILYKVLRALFDPLRDVPGPALTRYTRLWELYKNWEGQLEHVTVALHKKYGMISPLSISPQSIPSLADMVAPRPHRSARTKPI